VSMDDLGGNLADENTEMVSESAVSASTELRKRRSTRIVQAVPLVVTGVDALGRPFVERTSSLIINCHGCRYQSKHYVLKNMWVTLEIPHSEAGQAPRTVRGRVAWIQRPRTVRQLFQVALELEVPGNAWGIAFPPEDWFGFPDAAHAGSKHELPAEIANAEGALAEPGFPGPINETELPPAIGSDNLRVFPSPASTTDASLQLARQVTRLLADAKQQIQAATREAAQHAVAAEHRASFEQWEQKFAAARAEVANETSRAIERIHESTDEHVRAAHAGAAEALRTELPRWLAPQLEQLTRDLTAQLSREGAAQREEHTQQLSANTDALHGLCQQAEEACGRLKEQASQAESRFAEQTSAGAQAVEKARQENEEAAARLRAPAEETKAQISGHAEAAVNSIQDAARKHEDTTAAHRESLRAATEQAKQETAAALEATQASWQETLGKGVEAAQTRWQSTLDSTTAIAQERAASSLIEHGRALVGQLQEQMKEHAGALRESLGGAASEAEARLATLRDALNAQSRGVEEALHRASETGEKLDQHSARLENAQERALGGFQSQLDDVLSLHRNELHRRSESLFEELSERIRRTFEETSSRAVARFSEQVEAIVQPHVSAAEEAVHRLAGGRSLLDAAMTLQQDRIRTAADESFAESLARFRENLGGVEQVLQESSQNVIGRNLAELETKLNEFKQQAADDLFKSAEWYEKKAQTQIQNTTEKFVEQAGNQLREKAGEISSVFASELDHSSRNFLGHTQRQMEEAVRDSFERTRLLFAEAAETTSAAFTDEIQRTARQELDGFGEELQRSAVDARAQLNTSQVDLAHKVSAEQAEFLQRFQGSMSAAMEASVTEAQQRVQEGFGPLLEAWKGMTDAHQQEMRGIYAHIGEQAAEQHRVRLENVSNQWLLATVASLDHQSREIVTNFTSVAQEKLKETSTQVFEEIGEALRERLHQITQNLVSPAEKSRSTTAGG
jgi:ribosome recycling factor